MKKLLGLVVGLMLVSGLAGCTSEPVVETFAAEYEMVGTTSAGKPKNDTFIFNGETTDGVITELTFDIIRNKGTEGEYSKKDIMGYPMNVSDVEITEENGVYNLDKLSAAGYDLAFDGGQYMVVAQVKNLTAETTFKDLLTLNLSTQQPMELEQAIAAYQYVATEAGIEELTGDTLVVDLLKAHDVVTDEGFSTEPTRVSFAGYAGGRSYGEQIDAIATHILENEMTLEDVLEMFKTENQMETPIEERDAVSGATIAFVGDFQRMVYLAINGELFEGVVKHAEVEGGINVEVVTQGYGGEIETHVLFDKDGKITKVSVRDDNETADIGGLLTVEDAEFLQTLVANQEDVANTDVVSGATVTAESLIKAVSLAQEYVAGL